MSKITKFFIQQINSEKIIQKMVETIGFGPMTSCVQSRRSTN